MCRWAWRLGKWSPWYNDEESEGEEASDRRDAAELCLLRGSRAYEYGAVVSRAGVMPDTVLPATPAVVPTVFPLKVVIPVAVVAAVFALRALRFEEDRCRREGVGWPAPEIQWFAF